MVNMLWSLVSYVPTSVPSLITSENIHIQMRIYDLESQLNGSREGWSDLVDKSELREKTDFQVKKRGLFAKKRAVKEVQETGRNIESYFALVEENGRIGNDPFSYRLKGKFYSFD